jgi:hypothetical protein
MPPACAESVRARAQVVHRSLSCQALDRLSAAIAEDGQTIRTRTGVRPHPALRDELQNRALCARLLEKLGVTVEPVKSPGRPAQPFGWTGQR